MNREKMREIVGRIEKRFNEYAHCKIDDEEAKALHALLDREQQLTEDINELKGCHKQEVAILQDKIKQLTGQIDMLANFFLKEHQYKIRDGGAVENAIRLIKELTEENKELTKGTLFLIKKDKEVKKLTEEVERLRTIPLEDLADHNLIFENTKLKQQISKLEGEKLEQHKNARELFDKQSQKIKELEEELKKEKK